jgi:hypothetical protein
MSSAGFETAIPASQCFRQHGHWHPYYTAFHIVISSSYHRHHHHHHHHISVMELGHLLTRSDLTYPEVSSNVCHDSFCQLRNSVPLPWGIYYEMFYFNVLSSFYYIPVICPKLVLFLIPLQCVYLFCSTNVSCCSYHVFNLCCCYYSGAVRWESNTAFMKVNCPVVSVSFLTGRTRRYYASYSLLSLVHTVATAVKSVVKVLQWRVKTWPTTRSF